MTMQTRLLLCLLLLGLVRFGFSEGLGDEPVDGVVTETYLSGEVQRRYSVNEAGQKHGPFEVFAKDGTVLVKANYKDDLLDGRELRYFPSGKRHMVVTWSRGVLSGRWERFFESGQRKISTSYKR
ncbi:MAG: antitoxin component YwqK of YwqJK toxin-antitoxin module, partial [Planctomycetota bacterium]